MQVFEFERRAIADTAMQAAYVVQAANTTPTLPSHGKFSIAGTRGSVEWPGSSTWSRRMARSFFDVHSSRSRKERAYRRCRSGCLTQLYAVTSDIQYCQSLAARRYVN